MTHAPEEASGADWRRTHTCGELCSEHVGTRVTLNGWVDSRRDHGGIYFLDLRDRYGVTQVVLREEVADTIKIGPEYVLSVRGEVASRGEANRNPGLPTGEIELLAEHVEVLSASEVPPFEVLDDLDTAIETRLRHRYVDLRRAPLQRNIAHRSRFINAMRRAFEDEGFLEIETPILTRATPEGARDYLVPSRVHAGNFYALPQSPQIFKQILMVAGFDRYFQVARCFRDEDLRADRQPEFTQLDMEMSFVEEEDVWAVWERVLARTFSESMGVELSVPFARMRYAEAMERFGTDKPDTRFGMELVCAGEWAATSSFRVFRDTVESGGRVMGLTVPGGAELSRKEIEALEAHAKEYGARGLAWWKPAADGGAGPLARFTEGDGAPLMELLGAEEGDLCVFVADRAAVVQRSLGELRVHLGRARGLVGEASWDFLWVTHFPLFEPDEESGGWTSSHHPFTAPQDWDLGGEEADPAGLASRSYDLVLNGWELGSGSVRIHRSDVQQRVFELLGISAADQELKFGFLLEALAHGAPPHAGFAVGLDRIVALSLGLENLRDTLPFPKTTSAADLMCAAPSRVTDAQLKEVHIELGAQARSACDATDGNA
ncbi:MAG: aspartate--tRNA ligase [Planctomycetota bacterium]|nr:aspartate--tRNA ligase [Planctomycetota bacterium]MDP6761414.1 aspartate--tRNA ligase [Planctomycetota bacterium]MDP6987894.1 aspartate--tRNA ligase [Planctomycetota bacterium]